MEQIRAQIGSKCHTVEQQGSQGPKGSSKGPQVALRALTGTKGSQQLPKCLDLEEPLRSLEGLGGATNDSRRAPRYHIRAPWGSRNKLSAPEVPLTV